MATDSESKSKSNPAIWTENTPLQFPVPQPSEEVQDPWALLAKEKRTELEEKCAMWKDELQSLLTFTGLFSAVVAGFLAATYQGLSADPADTTNALLTQIAQRLDASNGLANSSSVLPLAPNPSFTPPTFLVRVHTFWFLSLAITLSTAVISILCLQWIREQQHLPSPGRGRRAFVMYSIRTESFNEWHVPTIIAYLPASVQVSLILFFVGLIYFVLPFGKEIAIPTIVAISATFLFLLYTTAAPTIEGFYFFLLPKFAQGRFPCPYRSPQAWRVYGWVQIISVGVYFIVASTGILVVFTAMWVISLPIGMVSAFWRAQNVVTATRYFGELTSDTGKWVVGMAIAEITKRYGSLRHDWHMVDLEWLRRGYPRLSDYKWLGTDTEGLDGGSVREWYYATQGLSGISTLDPSSTHAAYRCVESFPQSFTTLGIFPKPAFLSMAADRYNAKIEASQILNSWTDPNPGLRHAEYQMLALNTFQGLHGLNSAICVFLYIRQLEVYIRILGAVYAGPKWMTCAPGTPGLTHRTFVPRFLRPLQRRILPSLPRGDSFLEQLVLIWASFVTNLLECEAVPLGRYHRDTDIETLNLVVIPAFSDFIHTVSEGSSPPSQPILNSIQAFTKIHLALSYFLVLSLSKAITGIPYQGDPFPIVWSATYQYLSSGLLYDANGREKGELQSSPLQWAAFERLSQRVAGPGENTGIIEDYVASFKSLFQLADTMIEVMVQNNTLNGSDPLLAADVRLQLLQGLGMTRHSTHTLGASIAAMTPPSATTGNVRSGPREPGTPRTASFDAAAPHQAQLMPPDISTFMDGAALSSFMSSRLIDPTSLPQSEVRIEARGDPSIVIVPALTLAAEDASLNQKDNVSTNAPPIPTFSSLSGAPPVHAQVNPTPLPTPSNPIDVVIDMAASPSPPRRVAQM